MNATVDNRVIIIRKIIEASCGWRNGIIGMAGVLTQSKLLLTFQPAVGKFEALEHFLKGTPDIAYIVTC